MLRPAMLLLSLALCFPSSAEAESFDEKYGKSITDDIALHAIKMALPKLGTAICENGKACTPPTPAETEKPPISMEDSRAAMLFGIKSALAQWCGLDFRGSLLPMLAFGKNVQKLNERQIHLINFIHADFMTRQFKFYSQSGASCPDTLRKQMDTQLPRSSS